MNTVKAFLRKEPGYLRNTIGISGVEFFWGIGLPVIVESTFLQLFLRTQGASSFVIGSVPAFLFIGQAGFGIISAFITSRLKQKKTAVIFMHCLPPVFLSLYGLILLLPGNGIPAIPLFLVLYAFFAMTVGLLLPVWQNYLVTIFSPGKSLPALSVMMFSQSGGKLLGSYFLSLLVKNLALTRFSSGLIFLSCGLLFFFSSFLFLITREIPDSEVPDTPAPPGGTDKRSPGVLFRSYFLATVREILHNRNFLYYMGTELEFFSVVTVLSFYANFATEYGGISPALAAGGFVAMNYTGQLLVNLFLGIFNLFDLKRKAVLSRISSLTGILLLVFIPAAPVFLAASFFLGISRAIRNLIFTPSVKILSGKKDATGYFALAPLLTIPLSSGIPLICGFFLDLTAGSGGLSYRILFAVLAFLILLSLFFLSKTNLDEGKRIA